MEGEETRPAPPNVVRRGRSSVPKVVKWNGNTKEPREPARVSPVTRLVTSPVSPGVPRLVPTSRDSVHLTRRV